MSIAALVLSLCIGKACNDYVIDSSPLESDCHQMLESYSDSFSVAWGSPFANDDLRKWLKPYNIVEPVERVTSYDFTCPVLADSDIP